MTIKEQAALHMLRNASRKELTVAEGLVNDREQPSWLRCLVSQSSRAIMPAHEVVAAGRVLSWLYEGGGYARIDVGVGPSADRDVADNSAKLARLGTYELVGSSEGAVSSEPVVVSGSFWGGNCDEDGQVTWDGRLWMTVGGGQAPFNVPSATAHLEVGYVKAWQLWFHLVTSGMVARWPYGDTSITILVLRPEYWRQHVAIRLG